MTRGNHETHQLSTQASESRGPAELAALALRVLIMGHSEQWQRDLDSAAEVEHSVWAALERAKAGQATADDWQLIEWACGFSAPQRPALNIDCAF